MTFQSFLLVVLLTTVVGSSARGIDKQDFASHHSDSHVKVPVTVNLKWIEKNSFKGHVKFHDFDHEVHLEKAEPVLTPNFQAFVTSRDSSGEIASTPTSYSQEEINAMEDDIYIDRNSHAAFSVQHANGKSIRLHGVLSGVHVTQDGDSHIAYFPRQPESWDRYDQDHIRSNRTLTYSNGYRPDMKAVTVAKPELFFTLDMLTFQSLGKTKSNVTKYLTIFVHDMNNRYAAMSDPKITFQLVGYHAVAERKAQPFLENSRVGKGLFLLDKITEQYSKYLNDPKQQKFPKFDSSPLLTGESLAKKAADGSVKSGYRGTSFVRGACDKDTRISINSDKRAFWQGVNTVIHETAHNLGANDDGFGEAKDCAKKDGNLMSHQERWGEKSRFYFSKCSKRLIKNFINSDQGKCLRSQQSKPMATGNQSAGDVLSFDQQCKVEMNNPKAFFSYKVHPEHLCRDLWCSVGDTNMRSSRMPADNTPCDPKNPKKKCWMGDCIAR